MKRHFIALFVLSGFFTHAQSIVLSKGNPSVLNGVSTVRIEFKHDSLLVNDLPEDIYVLKVKTDLNAEEGGRGDEWEKKWLEDMRTRFSEKFSTLFCKYAAKNVADNAPYKVVIEAKKLKPNDDLRAYLSSKILIVDSKTDSVITVYKAVNIMGRASGGAYGGGLWNKYDAGIRIQEAFAKTGKELGIMLKDDGKK